jgi:hypothetical protein
MSAQTNAQGDIKFKRWLTGILVALGLVWGITALYVVTHPSPTAIPPGGRVVQHYTATIPADQLKAAAANSQSISVQAKPAGAEKN